MNKLILEKKVYLISETQELKYPSARPSLRILALALGAPKPYNT